jgi:predicted nucleotidyltransferase
MTALELAVLEVTGALEQVGVPYMLIGGIAVSLWGEPRSTLDVDVTIWAEPEEQERTIRALCSHLRAVPEDPEAFVRQTRVLPAISSGQVRLDIVFAGLPEEERMIQRAQPKAVAGRNVRVVSVEDLIFMKLASERPKDIQDARLLLRRFRKTLDRGYIEPRLKELAAGLARPDILELYEAETNPSGLVK